MSSRETNSLSRVPTLVEVETEPYHTDFTSPSGDFIVRSSDKVRFRVHRLFLQEASPVFRTMLDLPQPRSSTPSRPSLDSESAPSVDLPEDSTIVAGLLRLIYPIPIPSFEDLEALSNVLLAAEKYDMQGALSTLRRFLLERQYLDTDPVHVYALACHFRWKEEAHLASRLTLTHDILDPKYLPVFASTGLSTSDLFALVSLRHKRIEGMRSFLDGDGFEGNAPGYECSGCNAELNDTTWPFLKAAIVKEMYRRPLGDGVFGVSFLENVGDVFIGGKCAECGEKCYNKAQTLANIRRHLDALPHCACESCDK